MNTKINVYLGIIIGMLIIFVLTIIFSWHIKSELSNLYILGNELNKSVGTNTTLERLISENKLISAKDFFGFYISYYNNFIVILSCIIGVSALTSFIYIRNRNEETNEKIKVETKNQIDNFLKNEIDVKNTIQNITEYSIKDIVDRIEQIERNIENIQDSLEMQNIDKELTKPMRKD